MEREVTPLSQRIEVQLQRVAAGAGDGDGIGDGDAAVVAGVVQDLDRQLRQLGEQQSLTLDLPAQSAHLALQGREEEGHPPRLRVWIERFWARASVHWRILRLACLTMSLSWDRSVMVCAFDLSCDVSSRWHCFREWTLSLKHGIRFPDGRHNWLDAHRIRSTDQDFCASHRRDAVNCGDPVGTVNTPRPTSFSKDRNDPVSLFLPP